MMGTQQETDRWSAELACISTRLEELKARSDEEYEVLHSLLDEQIRELQSALNRLEADVHALRPEAYARRVAAQIDELKTKGDAAYERLQAST